MGFLSSIGNLLGFESGIGASVGQIGPGPDTTAAYANAEQLYRDNIAGIGSAFDKADLRAEELSRGNAQLIQDQGQQSSGNLLARLSGSGLLGTSVAPNLARGIVADQSRSLLLNNQSLAQQRIGLDLGRGQAVAGARGGLAQQLMARSENDRSFFLNREGLRIGRDKFVSQSRQNRAAGIGDTVGSLTGLW